MLKNIPSDIKFGDIFYMKNCNSHIVYVGKINEDNASVYEKFTRKISRNNPSFLRENLDTHSHIFITFDNGLYYYQLNDDFEQCSGGIKEVLPNYNKPIPEDLSKILNEMKQLLGVEKMKTMSSEKVFVCYNRQIFCSQYGRFVKYANEVDDRLQSNKVPFNPELWQPINIDYPTYLILTGLKEKSKETELAEIKAKILSSETLGCQKDVMAPLVEDLLALVHKVEGLKRYKKEVSATIFDVAETLMMDRKNEYSDESHRYQVTSGLLKDYVKKLQEK